MPKGPKGEKRPADVIGTAIKVAKIATGEIEDKAEDDGKNKAAQALGRLGVHAPVHEADQRIFEADYKPLSRLGALLRLV